MEMEQNTIKVRVCHDLYDEIYDISMLESSMMQELKRICLHHFTNSMEGGDDIVIVKVPGYEQLSENQTIGSCSIKDSDLVILTMVNKDTPSEPYFKRDDSSHFIADKIAKAVEGMPHLPKGEKCPTYGLSEPVQFYDNLMKCRLLLGLAHNCLTIIATKFPDVDQIFGAILVKLKRRHRTNMKPESIKQLQEEGYTEEVSMMALKQSNSVTEAIEWLEINKGGLYLGPPPPNIPWTVGADPIQVFMPKFWHFKRTHFEVKPASLLTSLTAENYSPQLSFDSLMQCNNNLDNARKVLEAHSRGVDQIYSPLHDDHPMMAKALNNSKVQAGFHLPKVLYALLALCESPNNTNLWLSDPDTTGIIKSVFRVYHEEKSNIRCKLFENS